MLMKISQECGFFVYVLIIDDLCLPKSLQYYILATALALDAQIFKLERLSIDKPSNLFDDVHDSKRRHVEVVFTQGQKGKGNGRSLQAVDYYGCQLAAIKVVSAHRVGLRFIPNCLQI
ncbi:hypothetical protein SUGI_0505800 [Cryptomeria japonica]|nr:hypothetical protein SUGI_0505800 [Cryptomeria japonica]